MFDHMTTLFLHKPMVYRVVQQVYGLVVQTACEWASNLWGGGGSSKPPGEIFPAKAWKPIMKSQISRILGPLACSGGLLEKVALYCPILSYYDT